MNDFSELQYSRSLIESRFAVKQSELSLTEVQKEFINRISSAFDPFSHSGSSVFSASFCEDGNLLSQWRAYRGKGGGYCIGFDFFHTLRHLSKPCVLRRVIYDKQEQIELIDSTIDTFLSTLLSQTQGKSIEEVTATFLPALCMAFHSIIGEYMFSFKHPDFHEEKEWRLVHSSNINPTFNRSHDDTILFRNFDGNIIPYLTVSFEEIVKASRDDAFGFPFPISELHIGPTVNDELNNQSIRMLLSSLNPEINPNVKKSEIPLRWL